MLCSGTLKHVPMNIHTCITFCESSDKMMDGHTARRTCKQEPVHLSPCFAGDIGICQNGNGINVQCSPCLIGCTFIDENVNKYIPGTGTVIWVSSQTVNFCLYHISVSQHRLYCPLSWMSNISQ